MATRHVPILLEAITRALTERLGELGEGWIVDCTLGGGGHTAALLEAARGSKAHVLAIDRDQLAIERASARFASEIAQGKLELRHGRMSELEPILQGRRIIGLLADLGFSSDQIDDPMRGLSFQQDGPLDMRMDPSRGLTAREFLAQSNEREIEATLRELGEERFSKRIASAIFLARREGKLPKTTRELSELVVKALPPPARHASKIHPATRVFQALRIQVNEEMSELETLLKHVMLKVQPGGRVAILSFHSLEDRQVKQAFKLSEGFEPLTKKPLEADVEEVSRNPRARSAKLRIAERTG
jgi:16S rRNA (cytosine1402-N4)-methyltransferase